MAINIKFDLANNPETPTLVLANRNGNKLGQLYVNPESVELIDKFNEASEISFTVNKYLDDEITPLWDKLLDFKLIYCKEWDCWFEAKVELDEATESVKTVFCTQLGQAELSQIMLYDIEINTEIDIERDDYKIGILYDPLDSQCILRRLLDKAPHYSIIHVDDTLCNIQRSFSFDSISIYDAFQEIAEEIGCLFVFNSDSDADGMPQRTISVYDLQQNCKNEDCRYRGEFTDKCPKCGSTDITYGYGKDTLIFVTSDELASQGIQLVTDTDSVKNCFKLEAGDDLMTATIRNRNPNGTDYIWYFSETTKEDMPDELVEKIEKYDKIYDYYYTETNTIPDGLSSSDIKIKKPFTLNSSLVSSYNNNLVEKYSEYYNDESKGKVLVTIPTTIMGFASLMEAYYNTIDLGWYLKSGMMPPISLEMNAESQGKSLEGGLPSLIAVLNLETTSKATADSAVLTMARAIVNSSYKVTIDSSSYSESTKEWSGVFTITNYSDEEDTYTTYTIGRTIVDFDETYIQQKIDKMLSKENTDDYSITGLFEKDYNNFCAELKKYALAPLTSFHDACQSCLDILIEQGTGDKDNDLYDTLYYPYYEKLIAIESEIKTRENEINIVIDLQENIENIKENIQNELNFEKYLGENLWLQFCAYRREDKYSNPNYISDGLNNAELFERALQFYEVAENEIFKSSELQHSISATLNNLLAISKFKSLVESFEVGNWIRVQVDDYIYKLRLVQYEISYGDFNTISVQFSDVAKIKNGYSDLEDILNNASSMATSYDSIQRQANLGNEARDMIRQWLNDGLDASLVQIQNNDNEDIVINNTGLVGRSYSDITEEYSPEQVRLTHNVMAFTKDNWQTVSQAIGKHKYQYYDESKKWYNDNGDLIIGGFEDAVGYGVSADFCTSAVLIGSQIIGGNIYSDNYSESGTGSHIDLRDGTFNFGGGMLQFKTYTDSSGKKVQGGSLFIGKEGTYVEITTDGVLNANNANISGMVNSTNGSFSGTITGSEIYGGTIIGTDISGGSLTIGKSGNYDTTYATINENGVLTCAGANINGSISASDISGSTISGSTISGTEISGSTISGNTISGGSITCNDVNISGEITATSGTIGGCSIVNGKLQVTEGNISGTLTAGKLQGASIILANDNNTKKGYISIASADSATYAIELGSSGAMRILANSGNLFLQSGYNTHLLISDDIRCNGYFIPSNAGYDLGSEKIHWDRIYVNKVGTANDTVRDIYADDITAGEINADKVYADNLTSDSDRNKKNSIEYNMEKYENLFFKLKPTQFKFNKENEDVYHTGFISQDVEDAIVESGLSTQDFAAFVKEAKEDNNGQYDYYLRYNEFISLNTYMIQKLYKRIEELESKLKNLS